MISGLSTYLPTPSTSIMPSLSPAVFSSGSTSVSSSLSGLGIIPYLEVGKLVDRGYWVKRTGSRVTTHFTEASDHDYVVFDPDCKLEKELMVEGWELGGSGDNGELTGRIFSSLKKGKTNFIVVVNEDQWKKWVIATNLIKALDPETKEGRVKIFNTVFGDTPDSRAVEF